MDPNSRTTSWPQIPPFTTSLPEEGDQRNEPPWKWLFTLEQDGDLDLESLRGYLPGGYHPIHLQDELNDGQYRVIHKLGHGRYSTVWLCRDQHANPPRYVAVKILVAHESERELCPEIVILTRLVDETMQGIVGGNRICLPVKRFYSYSPSGRHICIVFPVLGPRIGSAAKLFHDMRNRNQILRDISRGTVEGVAALHGLGICHGDLRPQNALLGLRSLEGMDEEKVLGILGTPKTVTVHVRKSAPGCRPHIPYAPEYLVSSIDFTRVDINYILRHVYIIDFGMSFANSPWAHTKFSIPADYAAPEVVLERSGDIAVDLWSLGCTLFEIRLGRKLFDVFQILGLNENNYMDEIASVLGRPPDKWVKHHTASYAQLEEPPSAQPSSWPETKAMTETDRNKSIQNRISPYLTCPDAPRRETDLDELETSLFAYLLDKLLRYRKGERATALEVLKYWWFQYRDSPNWLSKR